MKIKKYISVLLSLYLIVLFLSSCKSSKPEAPTEEPSVTESTNHITSVTEPVAQSNNKNVVTNISSNYTWDAYLEYCEKECEFEENINFYGYYKDYLYHNEDHPTEDKSGIFRVKENITSGDFTYILYENGKVMLTKYTGNNTDLVVPAQIDGYEVMAVGDWFCYEPTIAPSVNLKSKIKSVTFEDGIIYIGSRAFQYCQGLKSVRLPKTLKIISDAFFCCQFLKSIELPDGLEFMAGTFEGCSSLESITIPDSVWHIGAYTFLDCYSLKSVKLSDNIEVIDDDAFCRCKNLSEINVPSKLKTVFESAFVETKIDMSIFDKNGIEIIKKGDWD